ncbi:MAG: radical SAM protein [Patescibacteria group bacterium]
MNTPTAGFPNVPVVYPGQFPANFNPNTAGWGNFAPEVIEESKGKLLMLDLDFGRKCSLNCPHCFRKSSSWREGAEQDLSPSEIRGIIWQAKELGLRSVKILGAGEPFENEGFVDFLYFLDDEEIDVTVFTAGHAIEPWLAHGLAQIERLSLIVKFNTSNPFGQACMVGDGFEYPMKRNYTIQLLAEAGMNKSNPTRLGLGTSPIMKANVQEAFDMYEWAMRRNMFAVICPTMCSGRCGNDSWMGINPDADQLVELYAHIYRFNIEYGIQTLDQIKEEGISAYAGARPCNQVGNGLYVTLDGIVRQCPGNDVDNLGDVRQTSLRQIWENSPNFSRSGKFNYGCPAKDGRSIPTGLYQKVLANIEIGS